MSDIRANTLSTTLTDYPAIPAGANRAKCPTVYHAANSLFILSVVLSWANMAGMAQYIVCRAFCPAFGRYALNIRSLLK